MTNDKMLEIMLSIEVDLNKAECFPGHTVVSDGWNTTRRCWMFHVEH